MRFPSVVCLGLLFACAAHAGGGLIYGTVVRASGGSAGVRQPMSGLTVLIACPGFAADRPGSRPSAETRTTTDNRGGFTLALPSPNARGCQIRAAQGSRLGEPLDVFISGSSLKYEFEVDANLNLSQR